jgi:hypothetical protein
MACPPALVASEGAVWKVAADCTVVETSLPVLSGYEATLVDDLAGGVIYQNDDQVIWHHAAGAAGPVQVAVASEGERVFLQDVTELDGVSEIRFNREVGSTIDDYVVYLERVPLSGGETVVVDDVASWEGGSDFTIGGGLAAEEWASEGWAGFVLRTLSLGSVPQPWNPYETMEMDDYYLCGDCPRGLTISDDGSRVGYHIGANDDVGSTLIVVELATGVESQFEVGSEGEIDFFGDYVLVNAFERNVPSFAVWKDLSDPESEWQQLRVRSNARLLRSELVVGLPG